MKYEIKRIFPFPAIKQKTIHLYNLNKLSRSKKIGFFYDKLSAKTKEVLYRWKPGVDNNIATLINTWLQNHCLN